MAKLLADYIKSPKYLKMMTEISKKDQAGVEAALSWLPLFVAKLPDINWFINCSISPAITEGILLFRVGPNGILYMVAPNTSYKVGHIYELGENWAAHLFDDLIEDPNLPEWSNFNTESPEKIQKCYEAKLEADRLFVVEYEAAKNALVDFQKVHPNAQIVVHKYTYYYMAHFIHSIKLQDSSGFYMRDPKGNWYKLGEYEEWHEWFPCNIEGNVDHKGGRAFPSWTEE
jgi:hypothetical protein